MVLTDLTGSRNDVAIVGMACRFPGARNVSEYWRLLRSPKPQFATVPESRWRHKSFLSDDFRDPHSAYSDRMATLPDVGHFDARHYRIPPQRARAMDPQHRLLVDLAREAIQDAGWEVDGFDRENTAVIMGMSESGYREISTVNLRLRQFAGGEFGAPGAGIGWHEAGRAVEPFRGTALPGLLLNMGPASVSSVFDLNGESYTVDAACSGGLTAVADAVFALRAGRCRIALAGAVQLVLTPDLFVGLCRVGAMSPTGECRPFDRRADGFVLGEGAGVLVLRPLADALAAGDRIYAVIRGVGLSNDGTVPGGMTPQSGGQLLALRRAYTDAGIPPGAVGYVEAHGTATAVGDQVEIDALRQLRAEQTSAAYLGACKAVVGHSLGAAGMAGLIKSVLVLQKAQIVPQPDVDPAAHLGLDAAGLRIPTELTEWVASDAEPRRAGVSAFGFGGTNVHIVLEEAGTAGYETATEPTRPELLLLSAADRNGLARSARELADAIAEEGVPLSVVAATLARRALLPERLAVVADTAAEAVGRLTMASTGLGPATVMLSPGVFAGTATAGESPTVDLLALDGLPAHERTAALLEVAERAVSGAGLRVTMGRTPPCTLPPSALSPRHLWIVDDARRVTPAEPEAPAEPEPQRQETLAAGSAHRTPSPDISSAVFDEVARISAFPAAELRPDLRLVADLGFDSLMVQELEASLITRLPHLSSRRDLVQDGCTIADLVSAVAAPGADRPVRITERGDRAVRVSAPVEPPRWDPSTARVSDFPEVQVLEARLNKLEASGLSNPYFRPHDGTVRNTTTIGSREYVSFSSYNYLGLSGHPAVNTAVHAAVEQYGSSVSGSRMLAGERPLTRQLERELSGLLGTEDCLVLVSGHATNVTAIGHIVGGEDLIVHDALAHDSILQGCALSGARRRPFPHNDLDQLEDVLRRTRARFRRVLIVVEGVYSMDGDLVDLPRLLELKKRYGALLLIDEAHSIGTVGRGGGGVGEFYDVDRADVDLWMGTLSKSFASCGGYLAGSAGTVNWLRYTLPGFVYSVGLTPPNAAAALAALEVLKAEPQRVSDLRRNSALFLHLARQAGLATGSSGDSPIVPCIIGDSDKTLRLAGVLFERGIVVDPILYPAVDERQARLRFFVTSEHREHEIRSTVSALATEVRRMQS